MMPMATAAFGRGQDLADGVVAPSPVVVTEDPYWRNVSYLLDASGQANGTGYVTDESRWGHGVGYSGNAQITSEKFVFDGSGDIISSAAATYEFLPSSAGFTVELFGVSFNAATGTQYLIGPDNRQTIDNGRGWRVSYDGGAGTLAVTVFPSGTNAGTAYTASFAFVPVVGASYDIAWSWDGSNIRIYLNGVYKAKVAQVTQSTVVTSGMRLGSQRFNGADQDFFNGAIKAVRVTRGVDRMAASETTYTRHGLPLATTPAAFTDPYWDKVVLLIHGEGADGSTRFYDRSSYARPCSGAGSAQNDNDISVAGTPSILLGADGTYVVTGYSADLNIDLSATDFCMEAYGYMTSVAVNNQLFGRRRDSGQYILDINGTNIRFLTFNGTTATTRLDVAAGVAINTVYHICVIRIAGTYYGFIDGVLKGSSASPSGTITTNTTGVLIGDSETNQTARFWRGSVNWARITMGHARYNPAGFSPPAVPYAMG